MPLSKEQILSAPNAAKVETIPTPEWGENASVCVRSLKGTDRERLAALNVNGDGQAFFMALVAATLCDESGTPLDFKAEDVAALSEKGLAPLVRIFNAASSLNGFGATAVEGAKGNS